MSSINTGKRKVNCSLKIRELYFKGKNILLNSDNISYSEHCPDLNLIFELCTGLDRTNAIVHGNTNIDETTQEYFLNKINLRANGYPLQYILGEWEFMGIKLKVGEGVLIPREDTACVIDAITQEFKADSPINIIDLCAGSGAISIALSNKFPNAKITAVELYDNAFKYLETNIKLHKKEHSITEKKADVLKPLHLTEHSFDIIVSNPPYIAHEEIASLQSEVLHEPMQALDGGNDGLLFYKSILKNHLNLLKSSGTLVFEFGDGQKESILSLLKSYNFNDTKIWYDNGNNPRAVIAHNSH